MKTLPAILVLAALASGCIVDRYSVEPRTVISIDDDALSLRVASRMTKEQFAEAERLLAETLKQLPLLEENGISITMTHLTVAERAYKWEELAAVRLERRKGNWLARRSQTFHLVVSTRKDPALVSVFETPDGALAERIQQAIHRVAQTLSG